MDIGKLEKLIKDTESHRWVVWRRDNFVGISRQGLKEPMEQCDYDYIAEACSQVPELIRIIRELVNRIRELETTVDELRKVRIRDPNNNLADFVSEAIERVVYKPMR